MSKRRRQEEFRPRKKQKTGMTIVKTGGNSRTFVPRSLGNPLAITERKYFDAELSGGVLVASATSWANAEFDPATLNTLFAPTPGDDFNNRTGRKVQVLSIKIRGHIQVLSQTNQTAEDNATYLRMCLVQDRQTNATQLNAEDVINSGAASVAVNMFQNPAFFGRFRVIKDKTMVLSNPASSFDGTNIEQNGLVKPFKLSIKFKKPVVVHFNSSTGGTVADCVDNSFHLIALCSSVELAPTINYKVRTTFIDV